jgi:hypothetical protein
MLSSINQCLQPNYLHVGIVVPGDPMARSHGHASRQAGRSEQTPKRCRESSKIIWSCENKSLAAVFHGLACGRQR